MPLMPSLPSRPFFPSVPFIPSLPSAPFFPSMPSMPFLPSTPSLPFVPFVPFFPFSPAAPHSSVSATRSRQSVSSLYFHWIAVPLFRTSGSAAAPFFSVLPHPAASTMQSAKSVPVSSFFPVFIFFPPFGIVYHGGALRRCPRRKRAAADRLMLGLLCTYPQTGRPPALRPPSGFEDNIRPRTWRSVHRRGRR